MARVEDSYPSGTQDMSPGVPCSAPRLPGEGTLEQQRSDAHKFRILCDSAPLGIFECLRSGQVTYYNRQLLDTLGISPEQDISQAWADAVHAEDWPGLWQGWQRTLKQGDVCNLDYRVQSPTRGLRWVRMLLTPVRTAAGEPESFVGTVEDITARKSAERELLEAHRELAVDATRWSDELLRAKELLDHEATGRRLGEAAVRESEERFRQLADSIDDIFWIVAADFSAVLYVSPACNKIWGRSPESFYAAPLSFLDAVHPSDRPRISESLPSWAKRNYNGVFRIVRPDGDVRTLRVRAFPVRNEHGEVYRIAGLTQDITESRRIDDELKAERRFLEHLLRVQEVERKLTAYDIHDGFVQLVIAAKMHLEGLGAELELAGRAGDKLGAPLKLLQEAIDEARRMISGLRPPIIDEQGLMASIEYLINEAAALPTKVHFTHQVNFTRLEPVLEGTLFRIVQEALNNVFRHSQSKTAEVKLSQSGDRLHLVVEDVGIGFNPRRVRGRRFGLRGIRERARLFGGTATVHSSPGQGTRVSVDVPLKPPFAVAES